jgi:hypothetical protein
MRKTRRRERCMQHSCWRRCGALLTLMCASADVCWSGCSSTSADLSGFGAVNRRKLLV